MAEARASARRADPADQVTKDAQVRAAVRRHLLDLLRDDPDIRGMVRGVTGQDLVAAVRDELGRELAKRLRAEAFRAPYLPGR